MVYSDFLSFSLRSFFCSRIPFRTPHHIYLSWLLRLLLAVTAFQTFLSLTTLRVLRSISQVLASQVLLVVENPPTNAGDIRDAGLIPESGGSPGGGHGNPLQYSCLENPMDRGAWWATTCKFAKSWTPLKWLSTHAQSSTSPARRPFIGIFI